MSDQPAPAWIRSTRPDGHRSLWHQTTHWHTIHGGPGTMLWISEPPCDARMSSDADLADDCNDLRLPVPTADDLAWLRGAR